MSNRVIRFRAWSPDKKRWINIVATLDSGGISQFNDKDGLDWRLELQNTKYVIWSQWTGLTDRNGVEIYEGDIVKDWEDIDSYRVVWDNYYASFTLDRITMRNDTEVSLYDAQFSLEVIGNTYENPELVR